MDPIATGLLTSLIYDTLTHGVSTARESSLEDQIEAAAEETAASYDELIASDLLAAMESDRVADGVSKLEEHGEPLPADKVAAALSEHEVARHLQSDIEEVVEEFLRAVGSELAEDPVRSQQLLIRRAQSIDRNVEEIREVINSIDDEMDEVEETGFELLTNGAFENGHTHEQYCWRRAFTLAEVRAGYALERERPRDENQADDDRKNLRKEVLEGLADGGGVVLLGAAGSGKTTVTRGVLSAWVKQSHDRTILYRTKGEERPVNNAALKQEIKTAEETGPVLVAVEDAAREGSGPVYEVMQTFESNPNVSFLVNSRPNEWQTSEGATDFDTFSEFGEELRRVRNEYLNPISIPPLDAQEIERFVRNYENITNRSVNVDPESMLERINSKTGISAMLLLAYEVPIWEGKIEVTTEDDLPALVKNVREVLELVSGIGSEDGEPAIDVDNQQKADLLEIIGLGVNILNAAGIQVRREFLLSYGQDGEEHEWIDEELLDGKLQGPLLFERDGMSYRTHHEFWSLLYLNEFLDQSGEIRARKTFERCVNDLFELIDSAEIREQVGKSLGKKTYFLQLIDEHPQLLAQKLINDIFELGERRPKLTPLFGSTNYSGINLPDACPSKSVINSAFSRVKMYRMIGDSNQEDQEIKAARNLAEKMNIESDEVIARCYTSRGHHARRKGQFDDAQRFFERALNISRESELRIGEATSLNNLGIVATQQQNYDEAKSRHIESLEIERKIDHPSGEAGSLNNLGIVAREQGNYEEAKSRHLESLEIWRDIGNRAKELSVLNNLGLVAKGQENYDEAKSRHLESLEIAREIGDRAGEASNLGNLGEIARTKENYEEAKSRYQECLEIEREIGRTRKELAALSGLSQSAAKLGQTEEALEACEDAMSCIEESNLDGLEGRAHEFSILHSRLRETPESTLELYQHSLGYVLADAGIIASGLLREVWDRREIHDSSDGIFTIVLAAGVGYAAHIKLASSVNDPDESSAESNATASIEDILTELESYVDRLNTPEIELYRSLIDEEINVTPADLREQAAEIDPESKIEQIQIMEFKSFAQMLELVSNEVNN